MLNSLQETSHHLSHLKLTQTTKTPSWYPPEKTLSNCNSSILRGNWEIDRSTVGMWPLHDVYCATLFISFQFYTAFHVPRYYKKMPFCQIWGVRCRTCSFIYLYKLVLFFILWIFKHVQSKIFKHVRYFWNNVVKLNEKLYVSSEVWSSMFMLKISFFPLNLVF